MEITPYLGFDGRCAEAFSLYEKVLGGKIVFMQTYGDSPMADESPADWKNRIMHARLETGGTALMGADSPPGSKTPQGFCVSISLDDTAAAERIFNALSENGSVQMPMAETFWAARFGMCTDRFGTPWMINCSKPM